MKFMKKLLTLCILTAIFCVPASAEETIDMALIMCGNAALTVNVDGKISEELSGKYVAGDAVTVTAPIVTGKSFSYWTNGEGTIISYNAELLLTMYTDTTVNAVYGTTSVTAQPVAAFLSVTRTSSQILFNAIASVPLGSTITASGIRYSATKSTLDDLKGNDEVTDSVAPALNSAINWLVDLTTEDKTYYAVAYVTLGGQTYYSDVKVVKLSELDYGFSSIADLLNSLSGLSAADKVAKIKNIKSSLLTVNFDANNGYGTMPSQGFVKDTASKLEANKFTRSYYDFTGWNTKADGTGMGYQNGASVSFTESTKLYAQWKPVEYTISYNLQGGNVSTANPTSYDVTTETFKLTNPTKTGYTFTGWTGSADVAASKDVEIPQGSTGNRNYTAIWTANTYTVKFAGNNGSGTMSDQNFTYDVEQALSNNAFTRNGYTFKSWKYGTNGQTYTNGQVVKNLTSADNGVITLSAQWRAVEYKVSFDLNGGELGEGQSNPTSYDINSENFSPMNPTKKGYDFDGWLLSGDNTGGMSRDLTIPQGTTGNREYIAQWKLHIYTLSYDLNGGTVTPDNPSSYTIESVDIELRSPDKTAYDFKGWILSGDANWKLSTDVIIPHGSTGDREYIAQWKPIQYAISYDLKGGTVSPVNPTSYDVESSDIKLTNPDKTGYVFTGWTGTRLSEASTDVIIPSGSSGDRKYTANWEIIRYTISYDLKDGSVSPANPTSYDVTTAAFKLTKPTRTGYTFAGWTGTGLSETSTDVTIPTGSSGNREYTATWTAVEYTIL